MKKNKREIIIKFRVNQKEYDMIKSKLKSSNCTSLSSFIRNMIFEGIVVNFYDKKLQNILLQTARIAVNINQIATRVNYTENIYEEDIRNLQNNYDELFRNQIMVKAVLCELSEIYPHMQYYVILAYLSNSKENPYKNVLTIYPEGIENVPKQFAINFRNDFMVKNCDMVVCYIKHDWGGAAQFVKKAKNKGRKIINIAVAEK